MAAFTYNADHESSATATLRTQWAESPGWLALYAAMAPSWQRIEDALKSLRDGMPLNTAETAALERWATKLGAPRYDLGADQPIADDDEWLRTQLQIRQRVKRSTGTPDEIIAVALSIDDLWDDAGVTLTDHADATVVVDFIGLPLAGLEWARWVADRVQATGVRMQFRTHPATGYYGFAGDADALPMDEVGTPSGGVWAEASD